MNLIKTSFYTAISTAVTFLSGFVVTKVVAVKIGPEGLAYVGQFQNTTGLFTMLGLAAINVGVIKYLAEYGNNKEKQQQVVTTGISIVICASAIISFLVVFFSQTLSKTIFHSNEFGIIFLLYGLFLIFISLNALTLSILNGLKEIKKLTIINILASIIGLTFTVSFASIWGLKGVLMAATFASLAVFLMNLFILSKIESFYFRPNLRSWNAGLVKMLFAFSLMNVLSGMLGSVSQLLVRDYIIKNISLKEAGYWQAVTRISDYYLSFITTVISVYYLPRLSELTNKSELRQEIIKGYKLILPASAMMSLLIFLSKHIIVKLLLTEAFTPMLPLFKYQLLGDFLKIGSWLLAFLMVSKALTKTYIITEITFVTTYILLSYWLMGLYGTIGATYAFSINYAIYWITMCFVVKKIIK